MVSDNAVVQKLKYTSCNPSLFDVNNRNEVCDIVSKSLSTMGCLDVT